MKREIFDMGANRLLCVPEQASSKKSSIFMSFSFGSFLCFGSAEAVREPVEMKQLYISTFPASSLGAHKSALEPTQNLPRTLPEPPQEPLLNPSRASPNRRQSDSKPIADRCQTDPNRVPNKEPKNGCQLGPHKFSVWRPSWPPCWRGSWRPLPRPRSVL